jgi:hypothetical protein
VKHALALPAALALAACGGRAVIPPTVEFPVLPDLPAETAKPCPPLPAITGTLGDLAAKDASAAIEYARCQTRASSAVGAYQTAQRLLRAAQELAERQKAAQAKQ